MIQARQLKDWLKDIPDDALIVVEGNHRCSVESYSVSMTTDDYFPVVDLKLTDGFCIVTRDFIDTMFRMAQHKLEV